MSIQPKTYLTPEQYLDIERKAEFKSEYYQGEMFPMPGSVGMAGAKESHNLLVANLIAALHGQLRSRPCRTYPSDIAGAGSIDGTVHVPGRRSGLWRAPLPG